MQSLSAQRTRFDLPLAVARRISRPLIIPLSEGSAVEDELDQSERKVRIVAALHRAKSEALGVTERECRELQARVGFGGGQGDSRHLELLAERCLKGFRAAVEASQETIERFDASAAADYLDDFRATVAAAIPATVRIFRDNGGHGFSFGRLSQHEEDGLRLDLAAAARVAIEEFELAHASTYTGDNMHELKVATLKLFARRKSAHRMSVIGSDHQPGDLESELARTFSADERQRAFRAINELVNDGLLAPTLSDIIDPMNWLAITPAGRTALERGGSDELDTALSEIDVRLVQMRHGAWAAALSDRPDAARQSAHSGRELVAQLLDSLAPIEAVRAQPGFQPSSESKSGVTRRMRLKYALAKRSAGKSESDLRIVEGASDLLEVLHDKLAAMSHTRTTSIEVSAYLKTVETVLALLLL
jgi:hypothetical protein